MKQYLKSILTSFYKRIEYKINQETNNVKTKIVTPTSWTTINNVVGTSNTAVLSFTVSETGNYLIFPKFRANMSSGTACVMGVSTEQSPQYSIAAYNGSITCIGNGEPKVFYGILSYSLIGGKTYYLVAKATSSVTIESATLNWYQIIKL